MACTSASLARGKAKAVRLCGQLLVVFRGEDGTVGVLDATQAAGRVGGIIGFAAGAILVLLVAWIRHARSKRAGASP